MKKIPSFTVNHERLLPGIYVSRKDTVGNEVVTTFDIRMKRPNKEPVLHNGAMHTIEHLAATYLRNNDEWKDRVIYWGPMGCLTGCYLILKGNLQSRDIVDLMISTFSFIANYEGEIPGAAPATAATICCTTCPWLAMRPANTLTCSNTSHLKIWCIRNKMHRLESYLRMLRTVPKPGTDSTSI